MYLVAFKVQGLGTGNENLDHGRWLHPRGLGLISVGFRGCCSTCWGHGSDMPRALP